MTTLMEDDMKNMEKALELINTFVTGDKVKASSLLNDNYLQHNLSYKTERDAFIGSVE